MTKLKQWKCHKVVGAAKIIALDRVDPAWSRLTLDPNQAGDDNVIRVDAAWLSKHEPRVGGYYVVYSDDYHSYSPAKAFEDGYKDVDEAKSSHKDEADRAIKFALSRVERASDGAQAQHWASTAASLRALL